MSENEQHERLRQRHKKILEERGDLFELYPDPVQALIDLFGDLPILDEDTWREIIECPYG